MARKFSNIPGMSVTYREGGLVVTPDEPMTKSVLVFGRGFWGPTNEPIAVSDGKDTEDVFGPLVDGTGEVTGTAHSTRYIGNDLVRQAWEAFTGGCRDVRCIRLDLDGTQSEITLLFESTTVGDGLKLQARYPGLVGNALKVSTGLYTDIEETAAETTPTRLRIILPRVFGSTLYTFLLTDYTTIGELIDAINANVGDYILASTALGTTNELGVDPDAATGLPVIGISGNSVNNLEDMDNALGFGPTGSGAGYSRTGGTNDTAPTITGVFDALGDPFTYDTSAPKALQVLKEYDVDTIVYSTYGADEVTGASDNITQRLVDFCHVQHSAGLPTAAILGVSTLTNPTRATIQTRKASLMNTSNQPATLLITGITTTATADYDQVEGGRYLSIIAGPHIVTLNRTIGYYQTNGAVLLAALESSQDAHRPLTHKQIPGALNTVYDFALSQINDLAGGVGSGQFLGGAYIVLKKYRGGVAANSAPTCAKRNTDYQYRQILSIANAAVSVVRSACEKFLGNEFGLPQRNAMNTAISSALTGLYEKGMLVGEKDVGYRFNITQTARDRILGKVVVVMAIRPVLELRWIDLTVSVTA